MLENPEQLALLETARRKSQAVQDGHRQAVKRLCESLGYHMPLAEHLFCLTRQWRFDFAWPEEKIALEIEGSILCGGRHQSTAGFLNDIEKYNTAASMGWLVLRATTLPKPVYPKLKYSKRTGAPFPRRALPWLSLADPEFANLLAGAFETRGK
jgi:hypothetical protein